jgi:hypothetical protein
MKSFRLSLVLSAVALSCPAPAQTPPARTEFANAAQPQLTVGSDGRVWLVYGRPGATPATHQEKHKGHHASGRSGEVFVACSADGGATFSAAVRVAQVPQLMLGNRRGPRIVAHRDRITVTVIGAELVSFTSDDGGRTWSQPITINAVPGSAREGLHDLAGAPDGRLFVTWLDLRNGAMELWGADSKDGGRTWAKNELVYKSPDKSICECCHPSALFDADGNLALMWRNSIGGSRDMWMTTRARGAAAFSPARKIGEGTWKLNACPMDGGEILALGGGNFGAVWMRNGEVYLSRGDDPEANVGRGRQPVAVPAKNGVPWVVWQQGADLMALGNRPGAVIVKTASEARFPSLVSLPSGTGVLLAFERGAKDNLSVVVERL